MKFCLIGRDLLFQSVHLIFWKKNEEKQVFSFEIEKSNLLLKGIFRKNFNQSKSSLKSK